jgi:hypothetical protein
MVWEPFPVISGEALSDQPDTEALPTCNGPAGAADPGPAIHRWDCVTPSSSLVSAPEGRMNQPRGR